MLRPEHTIPQQTSTAQFAIVAKGAVFWILWRHQSWSVYPCVREALALWRHFRRLFFHRQIGANASE